MKMKTITMTEENFNFLIIGVVMMRMLDESGMLELPLSVLRCQDNYKNDLEELKASLVEFLEMDGK